MTTDSFKKELAFEVKLEDGSSFNIAGVCKGAGMIEPSYGYNALFCDRLMLIFQKRIWMNS